MNILYFHFIFTLLNMYVIREFHSGIRTQRKSQLGIGKHRPTFPSGRSHMEEGAVLDS